MRITKQNIEDVSGTLLDVTETAQTLSDASEVWLDHETYDAEERRQAREVVEEELTSLRDHLETLGMTMGFRLLDAKASIFR